MLGPVPHVDTCKFSITLYGKNLPFTFLLFSTSLSVAHIRTCIHSLLSLSLSDESGEQMDKKCSCKKCLLKKSVHKVGSGECVLYES